MYVSFIIIVTDNDKGKARRKLRKGLGECLPIGNGKRKTEEETKTLKGTKKCSHIHQCRRMFFREGGAA